jgi:DNA repair exonuclease SbcCD ATPase subunit
VIIYRVHIRRFRKLGDQVLECGPGLNVIRGRNDAGKSTLHLALSAALFPVKPSEARTYGPWGEESPGEITMEFEADGRSYHLQKNFGSQKVVLISEELKWETSKSVAEQIGRLLGLASLSLFRATAHIRQWDLAAVQDEQHEIGTRLARIMTGGDADAGRILKALEDKIRRMEIGVRGAAKMPGPLRRDGDKIATLAGEQQRLAGEVAVIEQAAAERDRLAVHLAGLRDQVRNDDALLDANRRLYDLDKKSEELGRRATDFRFLIERVDTASRALEDARTSDASAFSPIDPDALRRLRDAEARAEMLAQEADARESAVSAPAAPAQTGQPEETRAPSTSRQNPESLSPARAAGSAAAVAFLGGAVGVSLLLRGDHARGLVLLVAALLAGAGAFYAYRRQTRAAIEAEVRERQREQEARQTLSRRREASAAADELRRQLQALGASSVNDIADRQERHLEARRQLESARELLEGLLGGRVRESLTEEYQRILLDLGATQAQREAPDLALRRLDPASFQRLQADAERRKKEFDSAQADLQRLEGRLSGRSPYEDLAKVEEELADIRARLERLHRQVDVLKLVQRVLTEAHRRTIVPGKERLEQLASEYLRALSGEAYHRLRVDPQTLAPQVWVGPPKEWADVAAREIGSGAVDQCYLALRLGLVDLLCQGRCPPLFLDDPLLAYDEERQSAAMDLLRQLARGRQIFLFTCRGAYDSYADYVLPLGEGRVALQQPR